MFSECEAPQAFDGVVLAHAASQIDVLHAECSPCYDPLATSVALICSPRHVHGGRGVILCLQWAVVKRTCPQKRGGCSCGRGLYVEDAHSGQERDLPGTGPGRTIAERLNWLFEQIKPGVDELSPGDKPGREYTNQEIANKINDDPSSPTTISRQQISKMRNGGAEDPRMGHCAALSRVFGVDPAFFVEDEIADGVRRDLAHILQLRELGVREVALRTVLENHGLDDSQVPIVTALIKALAERRGGGDAKGPPNDVIDPLCQAARRALKSIGHIHANCTRRFRGNWMRVRDLRKASTHILETLGVDQNAGLDEISTAVEEICGKPVVLQEIRMPVGHAGAWLETDDFNLVLYPKGIPGHHRATIIGHEFGHIIRALTSQAPTNSVDISALLAPTLDPQLVRRLLSRSSYSDDEEIIVEVFGTMVSMRRTWNPSTERSQAALEAAEIVSRIEQALVL